MYAAILAPPLFKWVSWGLKIWSESHRQGVVWLLREIAIKKIKVNLENFRKNWKKKSQFIYTLITIYN